MKLLLYLILTTISCTHIRFTTKGHQCVFPFTHDNITYTNCAIDSKTNLEWCYIDSFQITKENCARGNFDITSSLLIKSSSNCLYVDTVNNKLSNNKCNDVISNEKLFKFYWFNHGQIRLEEENSCLTAVDMPIIKHNELQFYGYVKKDKCDINSDLYQKWTLDENGMIINEKNKKCLVRDEKVVYLGDCIGNIKGYKGNEYFILIKYEMYLKELFALEKIITVYNEEKNVMSKINRFYEKDMGDIIDINTKIINYKDRLDDIERKINDEMRMIKKDESSFDDQMIKKFSSFGVMIYLNDKKNSSIFSKDISIEKGKIKRVNIFDMYTGRVGEINYNYELSGYQMIDINGMYIVNEDDMMNKGKFKIETNMNFVFIFNNKIILSSIMQSHKDSSIYLSEVLSLSSNALYPIKVILSNINQSSHFHIYFIPSFSSDLISSLKYLPMYPSSYYKPSPKEVQSCLHPLECEETIIIKEYEKYLCKSICKDRINSICNKAYQEGVIGRKGGIIGLKKSSDKIVIEQYDYSYSGIYEMMTDVKLGYYKDNNKQLEGYVIKMEEGDKDKKGKSYVMYKKGIVIEKDDEVITEIGINCDSSNGYNKGDNEEIVHDIVNEFSLIIKKEIFNDFIKKDISEQYYIKDINLRILSQEEYIEDSNSKNSTIKVCRNNQGKIIILESSYSIKSYSDNIIDEDKIKCNKETNHSECIRLIEEGYIPTKGGVISKDKNDNYEVFSSLPMIVNYNNNFKVYHYSNESELSTMISKYRNDMMNMISSSSMSSFIELSSHNEERKKYSKNFLSKIESAIESISSKIISNNDFLKQIENSNNLLNDKLNKFTINNSNTTNSISLLFSQIHQIEESQKYLSKQITNKLLSIDKAFNDTILSHIKPSNIFNLFYIIDSYYSKGKSSIVDISPIEHSLIISSMKSIDKLISTYIISTNDYFIKNINIKFTFKVVTKGNFAFIFSYLNEENYDMILMSNNNNKAHISIGEIKRIKVINNEYNIMNDIQCENMIKAIGACLAYSYNKDNYVHFYCDNDRHCRFDINDIEMLRFSINREKTQIGFGVNDFDSSLSLNNIIVENNLNNDPIPIEGEPSTDNNSIKIKNKLYYNARLNSFDVKSELSYTNKDDYPMIDISTISNRCIKISPNENICNYLTKLITEENINIGSPLVSLSSIEHTIKLNCISKMKSSEICSQIIKRVLPVMTQLKNIFEIPIRPVISEEKESMHTIQNLINQCGFNFLPKFLKTKKICMNQMMIKEMSKQEKNSECYKEYCYNCCDDNYSNEQCELYCKQ